VYAGVICKPINAIRNFCRYYTKGLCYTYILLKQKKQENINEKNVGNLDAFLRTLLAVILNGSFRKH